ncbi:hypothetical protein HDEF_2257 [Candidatus Hamiltonella defensa 5AT (Acyrthosiphon pisum)]|uniref:Uncharacterized protein n=1 Tax=Hamiltonella defensa subsp. Acyrthosiphon pisum (strain 5AT) TaxID=572265 RepID=C4K8E3_HAMD5|nr:hypothetical protein HDEF_2257 [Candidatus Hamiltonella defensa 5AT (Acyrthosiphon pisum)]
MIQIITKIQKNTHTPFFSEALSEENFDKTRIFM